MILHAKIYLSTFFIIVEVTISHSSNH